MLPIKPIHVKTFAAVTALLLALGVGANARVSVSPSSVNFGGQAAGTASSPVTVTVSNTSRESVKIQRVSLTSLQFTYSGPSLPLTLRPGQDFTGAVRFDPTAAQNYSAALSFRGSNGRVFTVPLSGTGIATQTRVSAATSTSTSTISTSSSTTTSTTSSIAPGTIPSSSSTTTTAVTPPSPGILAVNPATLNFGNVNVGSTASQAFTLTNSGGAAVAVSNISISGPGFNATGVPAGSILSSGQTASLNVTFVPASTGGVTGAVTISSNASNPAVTISLTGDGATPPPTNHVVSLIWSPDTTPVTGYNVYSSTVSGGPYNKLTPSPIPGGTYSDSSVKSGATYYYVVTAVSSSDGESGFSSEVSAAIP